MKEIQHIVTLGKCFMLETDHFMEARDCGGNYWPNFKQYPNSLIPEEMYYRVMKTVKIFLSFFKKQ